MEELIREECGANYVPLTPISFIERAAKLFPQKTSIIHHHDHDYYESQCNYTWKLTHQRCTLLASALSSTFGISYGHLVVAIAPNIPELYELHFAVPMTGAILTTLNPSLDATTLSLILDQLHPKLVFVTEHHIKSLLSSINTRPPLVVITTNCNSHHIHNGQASTLLFSTLPPNSVCYSQLLKMGDLEFQTVWPKHECDPILVNYTSGSTGIPKGVVYSHRSVYLNTLAEILRSDLRDQRVVFLWTADMFRANGWGFTWAIAALAGTNVFLGAHNHILGSISLHKVTHLSGHPSVLFKVVQEADDDDDDLVLKLPLPHKVFAHIAGTLPPSDTVIKVQEMGFEIVHRYGMTEVLGAPVNTFWKLNPAKPTAGSNVVVMDHIMEEVDVKDPHTMESVRCDGNTIGEVMFRGNALMMGYLKSPTETKMAFRGGWFHTGDLAVKHQDGCIQLKDRAKDIIKVCEGDSISSLEIERVLLTHPNILEAAVVAMPSQSQSDNGDQHRAATNYDVPCAFVKLKNGADNVSQGEMIKFCRERLPLRMIPQSVIFGNLAISSTGKVQKFILREVAKAMNNQPLE